MQNIVVLFVNGDTPAKNLKGSVDMFNILKRRFDRKKVAALVAAAAMLCTFTGCSKKETGSSIPDSVSRPSQSSEINPGGNDAQSTPAMQTSQSPDSLSNAQSEPTNKNRRCVQRIGAGDGNRTHAASLEGWNSTIELHPQISTLLLYHVYCFLSRGFVKFLIKTRPYTLRKIDSHGILWYNVSAGYTRASSEGGECVDIFLAFLVSVTAGLFVELLCKWLDGRNNR